MIRSAPRNFMKKRSRMRAVSVKVIESKKCARQNQCDLMTKCEILISSAWVTKSEHSDSEFFYLGRSPLWTPDLCQQNRLLQNYYSRQLTPKLSAERNMLLTIECRSSQVYLREANNKRIRPRKQIIRMNCRIMNS